MRGSTTPGEVKAYTEEIAARIFGSTAYYVVDHARYARADRQYVPHHPGLPSAIGGIFSVNDAVDDTRYFGGARNHCFFLLATSEAGTPEQFSFLL